MGETPRVRRSFIVVLAAVAVLAAACSSGGDDGDAQPARTTETLPTAGRVVVLTYNVAGLPQEISPVHPERNLPLISPLLNDYDLVLTQEDFDWWLEDGLAAELDFVHYHDRLRAEVTHEYATPPHPGPEAAGLDPATRPDLQVGDGIGILSRFPLAGHVRQAWTGCFGGVNPADGGAADCLAMKGFAVVTVELGGVEVDVYSLHAEAGGSEEDQRLQADNYEQLATFIERHSADRAILLGGDTNLHLNPEHADASGEADARIWQAFLERTGLTDACAALSCAEPHLIDKIAVRSAGGITLTPEAHDVPRERFSDAAGEPLSDHAPVVVTIGWART